jgi:hypothetical protein
MKGLADVLLPERAVSCDRSGRGGTRQLIRRVTVVRVAQCAGRGHPFAVANVQPGHLAVTAPLENRAFEWIAAWPNARHLVRTRDWLLVLEPNAGLALRLAALIHDAERNFPGSPKQPADRPASDPAYRNAHQARSAEVGDAWLLDQGAAADLRDAVSALVRVHEWGGSPEADLLQAADSISFLEVYADQATRWTREYGHSRQRIAQQFEWMYARITVYRARGLAHPFHERAQAVIARLVRQPDSGHKRS